MARAQAWYTNNDMVVSLNGLQSSTASSAYINNSTAVTVTVWRTISTASLADRLVNAVPMSYVNASNGHYRYTAQSTGVVPTLGDRGMAIVRVAHAGLDGEWRAYFRAERRGAT